MNDENRRTGILPRAALIALAVGGHGSGHADGEHAHIAATGHSVSHEHAPEDEIVTRTTDPKALRAAIDGHVLEIRTGDYPSSMRDPDSGSLLASVELSSDGEHDRSLALGSGDAGHYRIRNSAGIVVTQGGVSKRVGLDENAIVMDNCTIVDGGTIVIARVLC